MNHASSATKREPGSSGRSRSRESEPAAWVQSLGSYPWWVVGTVCIGALMGQIDASIAQIILPELEVQFRASVGAVTWVSVAYLLVMAGGKLVGLAGWQVENLVSRTTDLFIESGAPTAAVLEALLQEMERASHDLQSEASLVFAATDLAAQDATWKKMGYDKRTPQSLGVQAWQDAAVESMPENTILFFKQLRQDRVLRPI